VTDKIEMTAAEIALIGEISRQIGWEACAAAIRDAGADMAREAARLVWRHPRYAELVERRRVPHEPCGARCGRCSRCIHAEAWRQRGGRPFEGLLHQRESKATIS
jgi:hypothetical protein